MGNPLTGRVKIGTIGELLVQLRLLQYGVQAAPPIKDSGNDLIAIRGDVFRGVQVKTTSKGRLRARNLPQRYHILAIVCLRSTDDELLLDRSTIYLFARNIIETNHGNIPRNLEDYALTQSLVDKLFKDIDQSDGAG